jgi:hypothetical protein
MANTNDYGVPTYLGMYIVCNLLYLGNIEVFAQSFHSSSRD